MRKLLSFALSLMLLFSCIPAFAEEVEAVKTGLSFVTTLNSSKDGQAQANLALTAVTVDANGVITDCVIDYMQAKIKFDETGKLTTDKATVFQTKNELGDGYGMRKASAIGAEWNEQAAAFAAYCVGKTLDQLAAIELNEKGIAVDIAASCSLKADDFLPGVIDAVNNAADLGAKKGDALKLATYATMSKSKDATAEANGLAQVYAHVGVFTLNGDVITSCYIDAVQANVNFDAQGKITSDITVPATSKNNLKDGYGMRGASKIGKEWFEQSAGFAAFITGKTLNEAVAIARNPAETDVVASCTIKTGDFLQLIVKAAQ